MAERITIVKMTATRNRSERPNALWPNKNKSFCFSAKPCDKWVEKMNIFNAN